MATRIKPTSERLYEQDFYAWSKAQADLLRAKRYSDLDLEHLIEEVDDLGESLYRSARSRIRTIIEHLLKLEHSPAQDPRAGWDRHVLHAAERSARRADAELPTEVAADDLPELYEQARRRARPRCATTASRGRRRAAGGLPLQPGPDHRRLAAVTGAFPVNAGGSELETRLRLTP